MNRSLVGAALAGAAILALSACVPEPESAAADPEPMPAAGLDGLMASLPEAEIPELDVELALTLAAMPLSCLDRPHAEGRDRRSYLDTLVTRRVPGYLESRAFYGCWDWHSAVNSTWAMVSLYKAFPDLPVSGLMDEKLADHLSEEALAGELEFFEGNRSFERPYGWAWLLRLHAELSDWDHPDAESWAARMEPLAALFSERTVEWLEGLKVPSRSGAHSNTAFALAMMLDAARRTGDRGLERAIEEASVRLFGDDFGCPTAYEPWGSDFLSPCLEEAALMAEVLGDAWPAWLDDFLPPLDSREFRPLLSPTDPDDVVAEEEVAERSPGVESAEPATPEEEAARRRADAETRALASASHLIGLAFIRGDAMHRIADRLPPNDPRGPALRRIARVHAARGFDAMFDADYAGSHWIGTFALKYLLSEPAPTPP